MNGEAFKATREALGLGAPWLAKRLGVSLRTVYSWENGEAKIPTKASKYLATLEKALDRLVSLCVQHAQALDGVYVHRIPMTEEPTSERYRVPNRTRRVLGYRVLRLVPEGALQKVAA